MGNVANWPIRARRTVEESGETQVARSVFCRAVGCSIDLDECRTCVHGAGLRYDARGEPSHAACARPTSMSDPKPGVARSATAAEATPLSSVMTPVVWCVAAGLSTAAARRILDERRIGGLPVVDEEGCPVGVVTRADLPGDGDDTRVEEVMSPIAFTLDERAPIAHAAALMAIEGVHHLPVVGAEGDVVGMVSALDVVAWVARQAGYSV
jgi:CBS domain-containing protein